MITFDFQTLSLERTANITRTFPASPIARAKRQSLRRLQLWTSESLQTEIAKQLGKMDTVCHTDTVGTQPVSGQVASVYIQRLLSLAQMFCSGRRWGSCHKPEKGKSREKTWTARPRSPTHLGRYRDSGGCEQFLTSLYVPPNRHPYLPSSGPRGFQTRDPEGNKKRPSLLAPLPEQPAPPPARSLPDPWRHPVLPFHPQAPSKESFTFPARPSPRRRRRRRPGPTAGA